jgi:hypothetical protein
MSNHRAEAIAAGALFVALAIFHAGLWQGEKAGRIKLWEEQKKIIGIAEDETITFPSGAVMYASGRIERVYKIESQNPYFQGQCVVCHK